MKIDILTLFPEMFTDFLKTSIIGRAVSSGLVDINIHNIRDYSTDKHKKVDDYPFGGGAGMVLMPEPIFKAVDEIKEENSIVILLTPRGKTYNQEIAYTLTEQKHIILICGHYEGFDERIRMLATYEISIGDYVLTGGEIPAMAITDSVVRLIDGVITKDSSVNDSFNNNLLDYPVYTKPRVFREMEVPEVLLSGHHENISKWRLQKMLEITKEKRPDLLEKGGYIEEK